MRAYTAGAFCFGDKDIIYFYFITRDEISPVFIRIFSCAPRASNCGRDGWTTPRIYNLLKSFLKTSTLVRRRRSWRWARRNDGRSKILSYNFLKSFKFSSFVYLSFGGGWVCCSFFCALFFLYRCLLKLSRLVSPPDGRFKQNAFS